MLDWIFGKNKAGKQNAATHVQQTQFYTITNETSASNEAPLFDERQLVSEMSESVRGAGSYHANKVKAKMFEKDDLADVKKLLETKFSVLHECIGSGTYAEVYRGTNFKTKKTVAIKIIDLTKANVNYRSNFLPQELAIIRRLRHPRIVKIFTMSQVGNRIVLVMEYAAKGTLSDWIAQNGAFGERNSWFMFKEFFSGLHYMHSQSIAHRDLKLENILITHKMMPKLADFSFAIMFDGKTLCSTYCGSLPYFAPELLMNRPYNPLISDIWSLGVCFYIMINDTFPFKFNDDTAMLDAQLNKTWKFRTKTDKSFSIPVKNLVRKMLEPETNFRISANEISRHYWIINEPHVDE